MTQPFIRLGFSPRSWACGFLLGLSAALLSAPGLAAPKIFLKYGPLVRSIDIEDVEALAEAGVLSDDLAFYVNRVGASPAEIEQFREILQRPLDLDPVLVSRFFYTELGADLLGEFGQIVTTRAGYNGQLAIRAALVQAALSPEGLTALNVLQQLPVDLQIDVGTLLELEAAIERIVDATALSVDRLADLTALEAAAEPDLDYSELPDLTEPGSYGVQAERLVVTDPERDRRFYVNLYWPQRWRGLNGPGSVPVVVYSHGLAASPEDRQGWGEFMASHGFLVAMPQHPGSDRLQVEAFAAGLSSQIFAIDEFIDRPADISQVIDQLEQLNANQFGDRLNLTSVGILGHSLGGYTAMAVAGAQIDFDFLEAACQQRFAFVNVSLLLQCRALELPRQSYDFRDPRIGTAIGINPVESSIFGPQGLAEVEIPVALLAGSYDPATPAVLEQFLAFPWFTTSNRLLALIEGQAHVDVSELDIGLSQLLRSVPELTLAAPDLIERYRNALTLAFFGRYVARRSDYQLYLRSSYAQYLSQGQVFDLYMISESSEELLLDSIRERLGLPEMPTPTPIAPN